MPSKLSLLLEDAQRLLPDVVALRRRIHAEPELGLDLPKTRDAVLEALADLDLDVRHSVATSGIVASLQGKDPGPVLLLRADMDALPMPEDTGLSYASKIPDRMHACGHDAHTAMLVGAARLLAERRDRLRGEIRFMFQPGEELCFGARYMLEEGILDDGKIDAAFAIHIDPRLAVGTIASRPGPFLASFDDFKVEIIGKGGHASMPHDTLDPVPVACEIVQALQTFVTRRIDAYNPVVLTVSCIEAGTTHNVIGERARLLGTLRSTSARSREDAKTGLERVVRGIAAAHQLEAEVEIESGYPVTRNDQEFVEFTREVVGDLLGNDAYRDMSAPIMGAEDFSYVLQRWPGAMVFLGVRPPGEDVPAPCHSNRMILDEEGMSVGIALHSAIALRFLDVAST